MLVTAKCSNVVCIGWHPVGRGRLQQTTSQRGRSTRASAIIDSGVTRVASCSSLIPPVPAGLSGITNQRIWALLSHVLISTGGSISSPNSLSTARGSRAARARKVGSFYQYGGRPRTGQGYHQPKV